ncbi:MAG: hypothetical protein JW908_01885 [Anaerolineales bacterium]|nr:hypothetical protein [Anaerolineales bacterium]
MKEELNIPIKEMTPEIMKMLETKGLIIRLAPGNHESSPLEGDVGIITIYESDEKYGAHMLISATINRTEFSAFGSHPDNEEVFLIGKPDAKPCYFLFSFSNRCELEKKVKNHTLTTNDFIALKARYNDPEVSFFTILKEFPHGEATIAGEGIAPSFYVTEQSKLPLEIFDFGSYKIKLMD